MNRSFGIFASACLLAFAAWSIPAHSQTLSGGLPNFGTVSATLFRGAQPSLSGFSSLHQMGVGIVVNFRNEPDEIAAEQHQVESLGMKYVNIPWSGHDEPSDKQIVQFLDLVRTNPQTKIFVHCAAGADRTGTMVAAYRIAMEHKSTEEALKEMHSFHYHHFWLPQLERYVQALPKTLTADAAFGAYAPALAPVTTAAAAVAASGTIAPAGMSSMAVPVSTPALTATQSINQSVTQ